MADNWWDSDFLRAVNQNIAEKNGPCSGHCASAAELDRMRDAIAGLSQQLPRDLQELGCSDEAIAKMAEWWKYEAVPSLYGRLLEARLVRALAIQFELEYGPDWQSNPEASAKHQQLLAGQTAEILRMRNTNDGGGTLIF